MRYVGCLFLVFILLGITGCSSKVQPTQKEVVVLQEDSNVEEKLDDTEQEEFLDEFEDEMDIEKKSDPFNGYNRLMTNFNDKVYEYIITPTTNGYKYVVHKKIRVSVNNFFHNILYPIRLVNNLLQGKVQNSLDETARFLVNSTVGVFGLFDPAKHYLHIEPHNEDFGQTLGFYGVPSGPHIVLPFLGPSNLRDLVGFYPDFLVNPIVYNDDRSYNLTNSNKQSFILQGYYKFNSLSLNNQEYEKLKKDAIDLYPYLRDVYEQYRENQIKE